MLDNILAVIVITVFILALKFVYDHDEDNH